MDILKELLSQRISRYCFFLGMMGGLATFFGPNRLSYIKTLIGVTIGCMILGKKFPKALKDYFRWANEITKSNSNGTIN